MNNALQRGEAGEALRELALKLDAGEVPVMILGQLAWFVAHEAGAAAGRTAVDAVFRTDLALKTSRGEPRVLLERLVVELCGGEGRRTAPLRTPTPRRYYFADAGLTRFSAATCSGQPRSCG